MKLISGQKKDGTFLKILECILYVILVNMSYYGPLVINVTQKYDLRNFQAYYNSAVIISFIVILTLIFNNVFDTIWKSWAENVIIMTFSAASITIFAMAIAFFIREFALPRTVVVMAFIIQIIGFSFIKITFITLLKKTIKRKNALLIGDKNEKEFLVCKLFSDYKFNGWVRYYIIPDIQLITRYLGKVDKIYISDSVDRDILDRVINLCISNNKSVYIVPKTYEIAIYHSELMYMSDIPIFKIDNIVVSWEQMVMKRILDLGLSIVLVILVSPLMVFAALSIFLYDGSPVIYTQERVTKNNKVFKIYKFRSMVKDAEKGTGAVLAGEDDPRITPVGKILRRFWLDELPQLFNVIKGDMSLVGPRPERPYFIEQFSKDIPDFKYRLAVKAGVTGYAQVMGKYTTNAEHKIKFDLMYIKNSSFLFDIKIIAETIKKIIVGTLKRGENKEYTFDQILKQFNIKEVVKNDVIEFKNTRLKGKKEHLKNSSGIA